MRILGIDFGEKRIGLALSDALGLTAQPLPLLVRRSEREDLAALAELVREREVEEIVIGLPMNMDGSLGPQARAAQEFGAKVEQALGLPVRWVDERLTTMRAERSLLSRGLSHAKRKARRDTIAAQLILQIHLDRRSAQARGGI